MYSNIFVILFATLGLIVVLCCNISEADSLNEAKPTISSNDHVAPQISLHYAKLQNHEQQQQQNIEKQEQQQQQLKRPYQHLNLTPTSSDTESSDSSSSYALSTKTNKHNLQPAYVFKADVPSQISGEANKIVNAVKLASTNSTSPQIPIPAEIAHNCNTSNNNNFEMDDELSKKVIGSSVVTSVSVVLNGDELQFTNALGQKVPKPQLSLQVASPIDLLNPDRYEFYTFDENGTLIRRLMSMEEVQSIVANGDGEGPTIIHHGPIADGNPEKNVQDIVNSVQSVLNKEVESNKKTNMESVPAFDTPDVSSSWSFILPAVFGNTGNVDILTYPKSQQVMTPDTEIIETSTEKLITPTTKKFKFSKRKPGQKRRTTTTEVTPQIIQEELNSQESVYTGIQQYQNLAATMHNYDGFSQLHIQPMYDKLVEKETSTRRVFINNQEIVKKPINALENDDDVVHKNHTKKPIAILRKPLPLSHIQAPNVSLAVPTESPIPEQKIKRKPTKPSSPSTLTTITEYTVTNLPATTIFNLTMPTTTPGLTATVTATTAKSPIYIKKSNSSSTSDQIITTTTSTASALQVSKKRKKKPTTTHTNDSVQKVHFIAEKRKPSAKPYTRRPKPTQNTKYAHITSTVDLAAEGTVHIDTLNNKFQHLSYYKTSSKLSNRIRTSTTTTTTAPATTITFSPNTTTTSPIDDFTEGQDFPKKAENNKETAYLTATSTTTGKPISATVVNIPTAIGTSGYPIPIYDMSTQESKDQTLPSLALTSKPYAQDTHTLLSFEQIIQTLKQPEKITENSRPLIATDNTPIIRLQNNMGLTAMTTSKPPYSESTWPTILNNFEYTSEGFDFEKTTVKPFAEYSNTKIIPSDNEPTSEYYTQASETPAYVSTTNTLAEYPPKNSSETTSHDGNMSDDYSSNGQQNDIKSGSHHTQTNFNGNRYSNQPQFNLSFLLSPNEVHTQYLLPNITNDFNYQQTSTYETTNDSLEHTKIINPFELEFTTEIDTASTQPNGILNKYFETQTETATKITQETLTAQDDNDTTEKTTTLDDLIPKTTTDFFEPLKQTLITFMAPSKYKFTSSEKQENYYDTSTNAAEESTESLKELTTQQLPKVQEEEGEVPFDTTTLSASLFAETTTFYSREDESFTNTRHGSSSEEENTETTTLMKILLEIENDTQVTKDILALEPLETTIATTEDVTAFSDMEHFTELTTTMSQDKLPSEDIKSNRTKEFSQSTAQTTTDRLMSKATADKSNTKFKLEDGREAEAVANIVYQMSEATSAELNAMISEEDETAETAETAYEDHYIKLGEATTVAPQQLSEIKISTNLKNKKPSKPIHSNIEIKRPTESYGPPNEEEGDEEDEEDQLGYAVLKLNSAASSTTTTSQPKVTTTRRLNTLKPVFYFNKQPAYTLYQEPVKLLPPNENTPYKAANYIISSSAQQRPMHRPPQLSNLIVTSTQSTRPPFKLDPSPHNSKGLEDSLKNLNENILAFSQLCNELAFTYWKSITSEKISSARSLVMSPFALTSMLSMVFLGARGSTSGEMNDVLKLDDMVTFNPHLLFKNVTDSVEKSFDNDIAAAAFVREIYSDRAKGKVLQFFKEKTQQLYAGHVEEVNFHVVNDVIRRRTNLLVKRHTMGKVLEYLRTNSVWVNGPLATISANLFQTDCSHGSTVDRDGEIFFQVHPTVRQRRHVPIPAVLFKSGFTAGYEPNLDATVVAFGRTQDTTSVIYVMPSRLSSASPLDNLLHLEKQLMETAVRNNTWRNLLVSLMQRPGVEVQIPRFSHRSFINGTLGLQKMGLTDLFKSDYADLGGLTGSSNRDIYLSDMIQINTFSTCGEEKISDKHHVEMYPAPPLRKRNKDVETFDEDQQNSSETMDDFSSLIQEAAFGRGFYDDLLDPKYLELPLPLRPRQARVPDAPRLRFDKPFLYFVRHNPTGIILFMGRFNPRLLP